MEARNKVFCRIRPVHSVFIYLLLINLFISPFGLYGANEAAGGHSGHSGKGEFDAGYVIIGHMLDAHEWHLFDIGRHRVSIPLPVIVIHKYRPYIFLSSKFGHGKYVYKGFSLVPDGKYGSRITRVGTDGVTPDPDAGFLLDLSITKNVLAVFISSALICLIFISVARGYRKVAGEKMPSRLGSLVEPVIIFIRDQIAKSAIGPKNYERFLPYLITLFFFIFINNLLGLVPFFPGGANTTGNISVTLVLASFTFITTHVMANRNYWRHIFNTPNVPVWLKFPIPLMPVIEIVGVVIKPFVLMIRLFANIMAGHMIILGFVSLIFVMGSVNHIFGFAVTPLAVIFLIFMNLLELLVAFIQAYVFTLFSALFFGMAVPEEHH